MEPLLSIILPVYKVDEELLRNAIDSIMSQNIQNYEVILIDDGSPDNSGNICDEYANTDNRIRVKHKSNAGVSEARNDGINMAQGKYICFMDPDDELPDNALKIMTDTIRSANADIAIFAYKDIDIKGKVRNFQFKNNLEILSGKRKEDFLKFQIVGNNGGEFGFGTAKASWTAPWSKIMERKFIYNNHLQFTNGIHPSEDTLFMIKAVYCAEKVVLSNDIAYLYKSGVGIMSRCSINACENNLAYLGDVNDFVSCNRKFPDIDNLMDFTAVVKVVDAGQRLFFHPKTPYSWGETKEYIENFVNNKYIQHAIYNHANPYYSFRYKILCHMCRGENWGGYRTLIKLGMFVGRIKKAASALRR